MIGAGYSGRWLAMFALGVIAPTLSAAEPVIRTLDVRGLRIGGTTTLTIDGDDLGTARLLLPFPAKQMLKAGVTDKKAVFDVTLTTDITPGYYHLRVVTDGGVSLPVVIGVDRLIQQPVAVPITALPVALHGTVAGGATIDVKFKGSAGQKVMIEVEAQRLGSKLRPVVHLYSPKKLQLSWAWGTPTLHGDTRLGAKLPEDGIYVVTLHDVEYAAVAPGFFRLRIGEWLYVDQVFPPVLPTGHKSEVSLIGPLTPTVLAIKAMDSPGVLPVNWPKGDTWSGPRPFVMVSRHAEFLHQPAKDKLQELPEGPLGASGKLLAPYEEHRYRVAVSPGKKVRLEVFAERIGSPIDVALVVRNDKGDLLARAEDSPGTLDPILEYAVPDKVTSIIVGVVDAQGRGGPRGIYRLVIDPQTPGASKDGFKLTTLAQRISLPMGGRAVVPVFVERHGHLGQIDLTANLPSGIKVDGAIPAGADGTLVTFERSGPFEAVVTTWRGKIAGGTEQLVVKGHPLERLQPWLATEIATAPSDAKAGDLVVDWRGLPADAGLVPGSKLTLPIKTTRTNEKTTVKLTLLTSQLTPILNNVPDPTKALRQEKPIELPVKVSDGEVAILVPVELPAASYDVTVQAELLDAAKKVLATTYAPVRRMVVRMPLVVTLSGPARIEATLDAKKGTAVKIQGKIERREGTKGDVALALAGLPAGAKADAVTVKADASDFVINVTFPPTIAAGEIKGVKLSGSFAPEPKTPAVRVRSREVDVTLVIQTPTK